MDTLIQDIYFKFYEEVFKVIFPKKKMKILLMDHHIMLDWKYASLK